MRLDCLGPHSLTSPQCWVNSAFQDLRLYLHYLWIFVALALTTIVYLAIFLKLRSRKQPPQSSHSSMSYGPESPASSTLSFRKQLPPLPAVTQVNNLARHPAFLIYPLIYVVCTTPLAAGRIASMAGNEPSLAYFCFAGAAIASNGFLDVILYASTRRAIVFSGVAPPSQDTGIETFAFMRTPPGRKFGNVVYVSGGVNKSEQKTWSSWTRKQVVGSLGRLRPTGTRSDVFGGSRSGSRAGSRNGDRSGSSLGHSSGSKGGLGLGSLGRSGSNSSQDSLKGFGWGKGEVMGMAIQCDTVTSVVIEEDEAVKDGASSIRSGSAAGHHGPTVPPATVAPGRKGSVASLQGRGRGGNDY